MSPCLFLVLFGIYVHHATGTVNAKVVPYEMMPPLTAVEAYAPCLRARGDAYCFVSAKLHGDSSHPLYNALLEYSANNHTRFDRTNVHRGICLKKTCHKFLNISPNLTETLEACLNDTMDRDHGLTVTVFRTLCSEYRERVQLDVSDFSFGAVVFVVLCLNLLGSLYDFCGGGENTLVGRSLLSFSVRRNWQKLTASPNHDPERSLLQGLSGNKVLLAIAVVLGHTGIGAFHAVGNPDFIEQSYNTPLYMAFYRSPEILQITYVMSALLLVTSVLKFEQHANWKNLCKALLHRWLRLTPTYAFMLFFTSTWARHVSEGPFWKEIVELEANDCRRDWWSHLLYVNNYIDDSRCMLHSWSLAVEMQLTVVGVGIFFLLKSNRARIAAMSLLLVVGMVTPAAAIFFKNLHPITIVSPEMIRNWFVHDPTFNYLYKRGHTNLICYGLGLFLGYILYNLKKTDLETEKYKMFRVVYWLTVPGLFAVQLTGSMFYQPELVVPLTVRLFYSSTLKLVTGILLCLHIFHTVVKGDCLSTKIFRWRAWTVLARLTFCVYILHLSVIRMRVGALDTTYHTTNYFFVQQSLVNVTLSFLLALPLFLLVEAPFGNVTRMFFSPRVQKKRAD